MGRGKETVLLPLVYGEGERLFCFMERGKDCFALWGGGKIVLLSRDGGSRFDLSNPTTKQGGDPIWHGALSGTYNLHANGAGGRGKEAIHEIPCPFPSYANVVSSGLAEGYRFVEGKIIQTGLRIGSSLGGAGCSGDRADRDFVCRPEENLKAIQDRRGQSKVV
ncbi:hypothetical protein U1Q18_037484, partial [Sarracenia purpurea var. burkii]